jgi:glycosyltransferase involved in cell wall biosynthesis
LSAQPSPSPSLAIIIPVYNERDQIAGTLRAAAAAIKAGGFDGRFIVIDDGSSDGTAEAAAGASPGLPVRVLTQSNRGRLAARRAGLEAAADDHVLFLDSRVTLAPDSLRFIRQQLDHGGQVWNAHVVIDADGNPYGTFWDVLTSLVFARYFADPRTTSYTADDFDAFPKGTTCFFAPTSLMKHAFDQFRSGYRDERHANDDTPILRWVARQQPIHISPEFRCTYRPRRTFQGFLRHAFHRGVVFLDGHGRRDAALFPAVVGFYPLSLIGLLLALKRPRLACGLGVGMAAAAGALASRRGYRPRAALSFAMLAPVYAVAHGAGMWRGLQLLIANRLLPPAE